MYGGPLTKGFWSNLASSLASGTISVCGVGLASDHPQKEHDQGKSPLLNFLPAASRMNTRSPSSRARRASCTSKRRQMSEMMCSMCGLGAANVPTAQAAEEGEEEEAGSTAVAEEVDDDDESEEPLPPRPPMLFPSAGSGGGGQRASPQSRRSSATRSALQGGRCVGGWKERERTGEKEVEVEKLRREGRRA